MLSFGSYDDCMFGIINRFLYSCAFYFLFLIGHYVFEILAIGLYWDCFIECRREVKEKRNLGTRWVLPILLGDLSFIAFSCLFSTVNHARYINAHFPILFLFGICMIPYDRLVNVLLFVLTVMMLIQSYYIIDPVSKFLFTNYNVGTTIMISATENTYLEDSMVYNQQYQYFDRALNLALEGAVHDSEAVIISM